MNPRQLARSLARKLARRLPPRARRLTRAAAHRAARLLRGGPATQVRVPELPAAPFPASWQPLLSGALGSGPHGGIILVVSDLAAPDAAPARPRPAAAVELRAACALGERMLAHGWGVTVRDTAGWQQSLRADVAAVVALTPRFDPTPVPGGVTCAAWAVEEADAWRAHSRLALFDLVLAGSQLLALRLRRVTTRPVEVMPLAAVAVPDTVPRKVSPVVVPAPGAATTGIVAPGVFEAIERGLLPVTSTRLGLAELGLGAVPAFRSTGQRDRLLTELRADQAGSRLLAADLSRHVRREHTYAERARFLTAALDGAAPGGPAGREPVPTIGFFPDFRVTNPYQDMLYARVAADGVRLAPLRDVTETAVPRDPGGRLDGYVLHAHWTNAVVQVAPTAAVARERLDRFRAGVDDLRARGGRLLWTVHNVLPHELAYRDLEIELCRYLAGTADLVHVMGPETFDAVAPVFRLDPARAVVVPHSSYCGIYPDLVTREAAREALGLAPGEIALLALGGIRAYRGLDRLLAAFDTLAAADPRLRLLVAGKPGPGEGVAELRERCEGDPRIVSRFAHLPTADLQVWNRAADLAVLPYRAILNSGAFKLAQTFGLPLVAPRDGALRAALDPSFGVGFDPDDDASLLDAVRAGVAMVADPQAAAAACAASLAAARSYPPQAMADDFAAAVRPLLGIVGTGVPEGPEGRRDVPGGDSATGVNLDVEPGLAASGR